MHDNRIGNTAESGEVVLLTLYKRLEAYGKWRFRNKIYASESYQDCVQKIMVRVWQRRLWEQLPSENDVYGYSCTALVNCIRDAWRRARRTDLFLLEEVELIPAPTSAVPGPSDQPQERELAAEEEWMKSLFPKDNTMLTFIEHLCKGKKRKTIASEMKLTPRQVTDLYRKLKRKVKRHLRERRDL
jgi:RNA polymerase sigma factor (sigma-70 family)